MTDINSRKTDHIALASKAKHQAAQGSGFDRLRFEPNPLPQMSLQDIALTSATTRKLPFVELNYHDKSGSACAPKAGR
jgi:hypothetical protein